MIPLQERHDPPLCPHCKEPLTRLVRTRIQEPLGKAYVWSCPHCRCTLGITHRKGFWMG
ncbi:MAG: hypothetical protein GXP47_00700 [Acidobacteria bacterium]|nr:hypothetical protein [Acidobacteriota bacterium]